jgi:hypothetical protein
MTSIRILHFTANVSSSRHLSAVTDAFGVKMKSSSSTIQYQDVLGFNDVIRGVSSSNFNASFGILSVPASHFYNSLLWMHVGIETPLRASPYFQMTNLPLFLMKNFVAGHAPTFLSKSLVVQPKLNTDVSINNMASSVRVTTAYWSSFQLNNLMYPLVAVFAETCCSPVQNKNQTTTNETQQPNKIFYKHVKINEGNAWNAKDSCFTARYSGIYVFSVGAFIDFFKPSSDGRNRLAADLPDTDIRFETGLWLYINGTNSNVTNKQPIVQVSMSGQPTQLTVSASCLLNLSYTDTVEVWLRKSYNWLPDTMKMGTSVSAFYYSPVSNVQVLGTFKFPVVKE